MKGSNTLRQSCLIALLSISATSFAAEKAATLDLEQLQPTRDQVVASLNTVELLRRHHYNRTRLDDALSAQVYDTYLKHLDAQRSLFSQQDIDSFAENRLRMDDLLLSGDLSVGFNMHKRQLERLQQRLDFSLDLLENQLASLDFSTDQSILVDREDATWPKDEEALQQLWRAQLKDEVLRLKLSGKSVEEIQTQLVKRYKGQQIRISQTRSEDIFQNYINALAQVYDPHTQYLSPENAENFDINMSLSLEGIGAVLQSDNEYTKIMRLVPAGPAQRSQQLAAADRIVGVAQADEEMTDVIGWRLDEVVKLIRGPKGSNVRLEVIPASNPPGDMSSKVVNLTREAIKLEDQAAKSRIIELNNQGHDYRIGVIDLPGFYIDFKAYRQGDPNYRSTTRDVRRLLDELQEEKVDGVVLDLRDNGGGSLQEATELTGLFIEQGPTVLVRNTEGDVQVLDDPETGVSYKGPLAVLVNRLSASASEIFAGAMQDYGRALVIGEPTFGKGTVQSIQPLNHGELKLTLAKFYRVSGQSTQHRGVVPDIGYPSLLDSKEIGESALPHAMPWDTIPPARYSSSQQLKPFLQQLQKDHEVRAAKDPDFIYTLARLGLDDEIKARTTLPLNEDKRKQQQNDYESRLLVMENARRTAKGEEPLKTLEKEDPADEVALHNSDDEEPDAFLIETGQILIDLLQLEHQVAKAD
ncbi:MAG: carboxy terminal-processing peptidase [Halopseudomonas sp.]|uniref:carboxy terminal-processing peptidase n=1 Tax=Halopseudomonas sp. TaxID=2901191 RepID=UPI00300242CE